MRPIHSPSLRAPLALGWAAMLVGFYAVLELRRPHAGPMREATFAAPSARALTLDVVNTNSMCEYYSTFDVRPVLVTEADAHIELQRTFQFSDGCTWRSFETLDRVPGHAQFTYSYREAPFSCPPDLIPATSCHREGFAQ